MTHIAIMQPKWKLVEKIETKVKTIETRFYKLKAKPWNLVKVGESIFSKNLENRYI